MYDAALTFPVGTAVSGTNGAMDGMLGQPLFLPNGKVYRLCKNTSSIATCGYKFVVSAVSSKATGNAPTWNTALAGAALHNKMFVRVQIPGTQTGSGATSTTLAASDYFWGQISGPTTFKAGTVTIVAGSSAVLVAISTGYVKVSSLTTAQVGKACVGFGTHTATTTAVSLTFGGFITGLI